MCPQHLATARCSGLPAGDHPCLEGGAVATSWWPCWLAGAFEQVLLVSWLLRLPAAGGLSVVSTLQNQKWYPRRHSFPHLMTFPYISRPCSSSAPSSSSLGRGFPGSCQQHLLLSAVGGSEGKLRGGPTSPAAGRCSQTPREQMEGMGMGNLATRPAFKVEV